MDLQMAGKAFIVTGGTSGLGLATARVLLAEGAKVMLSGRSEAKMTALRETLDVGPEQLSFVQGDNAEPAMAGRLRDAVMAQWGRLDGLMISVGGPPPSKAMTTQDEAWQRAFDSVFLGTVRLIRDLSPAMSNGGAIALTLAVSAKEAAPDIPISNGLRPGLAMLVKSFAAELGPRDIRVNSLLPNLFATDRVRDVLGDRPAPTASIALGRMGEPAEFGRMAAVLLSPVASYISGAAIPLDGGQLKSL